MQINTPTTNIGNQQLNAQISVKLPKSIPAEAESINARVIFAAGDTVHLKTDEGAVIRARLEGAISLSEGSELTLTVVERNADTVTLRIGQGIPAAETPQLESLARQPALPKALLEVFQQLRNAQLPAEQKLELFSKALADFKGPPLTSTVLQEATALLAASAKAAPPPSNPQPAGVGQLLADLATLLETTSATPTTATAQTAQPTPTAQTANTAPLAEMPAPQGGPATTAPLAEAPAPQGAPATTAPLAEMPAPQGAPANTAPLAEAPAPQNAPASQNAPATTTPLAEMPAPQGAPANAPPPPEAPPTQAGANSANPGPSLPPLLPEQRQEMLNFVRQVVGELYPAGQSEAAAKTIGEFIGRMFAQLGDSARQDGEHLHKSARELEPRLEFMKDAIEHSTLPQREEALGQTNRILQQTEALREARLLCMQIPVQFEEKRQTAELYVFRREGRGGRKLDPQNATIMLALNTEHLGRLEAMVQTRGKEINLKLEIANQKAVPFLREQSSALPGLLAEAGFKLASSSVGPLQKPNNTPKSAEKAIEEFQHSFGRKLDFLF